RFCSHLQDHRCAAGRSSQGLCPVFGRGLPACRVSPSQRKPAWARLLRVASSLIHQVNSEQTIIGHWTLGGGTAMMRRIDHLESRDINILLPEPQLLTFLDPQRRDFEFDIEPAAYEGDGARSLKFVFDQAGEIDFIVARAMTMSPATQTNVEG